MRRERCHYCGKLYTEHAAQWHNLGFCRHKDPDDEKECASCHKKFIISESNANDHDRFCSLECEEKGETEVKVVYTHCKYCKKSFDDSKTLWTEIGYCNYNCNLADKKTKCKLCGKEYIPSESKAKSNAVYCSKKCEMGYK
jgi:hypothetical protein